MASVTHQDQLNSFQIGVTMGEKEGTAPSRTKKTRKPSLNAQEKRKQQPTHESIVCL